MDKPAGCKVGVGDQVEVVHWEGAMVVNLMVITIMISFLVMMNNCDALILTIIIVFVNMMLKVMIRMKKSPGGMVQLWG